MRLPVPLKGKLLVTVQAAVALFPVMDLLVQHKAHQGRVDLPTPPALVDLLPVVGSLVDYHLRALIEAVVTHTTENHLSSTACGTDLPHCVGELREIFCRKETTSESPSS